MFKKILVPIDGSEPAEKALDAALDLAEKYGAELEILNVFSIYRYAAILGNQYESGANEFPVWATTYLDEVRGHHEKLLAEALKKAKDGKPDLTVSTKLVDGSVTDNIVQEAEKGNFDVIVIGHRGLGGVSKLLLGSISDRVADHAKCSVLIVKQSKLAS
jgi:nucleotide-binding universal stress UspA family protein